MSSLTEEGAWKLVPYISIAVCSDASQIVQKILNAAKCCNEFSFEVPQSTSVSDFDDEPLYRLCADQQIFMLLAMRVQTLNNREMVFEVVNRSLRVLKVK